MAKENRYSLSLHREVREMRNAETILSVIRDRGYRGLPLNNVYRQLLIPICIYMGIVVSTKMMGR